MRSWEVGQFAKKVPRNPRHKAREVSFVKKAWNQKKGIPEIEVRF